MTRDYRPQHSLQELREIAKGVFKGDKRAAIERARNLRGVKIMGDQWLDIGQPDDIPPSPWEFDDERDRQRIEQEARAWVEHEADDPLWWESHWDDVVPPYKPSRMTILARGLHRIWKRRRGELWPLVAGIVEDKIANEIAERLGDA